MRKFLTHTSPTLAAALTLFAAGLAPTASAQVISGLVSTGRYERVEALRGLATQPEFTHIEVSGTVRTFAENEPGSVVLHFNGLTLVWDSAKKNDLQIIPPHHLPQDFESAPNPVGKHELTFKILIYKPRQKTQVIRLLVRNPATQRWEQRGEEKHFELPGLLSWLENEAGVTAGVANARLEGFYVKTVRAPTLLIIADASSLINDDNHREHRGHKDFLFFSVSSVFSVVKNVFGFVFKGGLS